MGDFFGLPEQFGGGRNRGGRRRPASRRKSPIQGAGSGFIIDKAGFILTNNHVVEDAKRIEVFLEGMDEQLEQGLPAKLIGHDELTDIALIQITELPKKPLPEAKFGDSDADGGRRLGHGDWQPVRAVEHRDGRRRERGRPRHTEARSRVGRSR